MPSTVHRGRPPFGFRKAGAHLEPDPATADVVRRIFNEYVSGDGLQTIATRLTVDDVTRPSTHDSPRNPHHSTHAWSKGMVRAILTNPRYANLIDDEAFEATRRRLAEHGPAASTPQDPRYTLRGRLRCGLCRRLMQGTWNNGSPYYRCRVPRETGRAEGGDHPANVYLPEARVLEPLHAWLAEAMTGPAMPVETLRILLQPRLATALGNRQRFDLYRAVDLRLQYRPVEQVVGARVSLTPSADVKGTFAV